VSTMHAEYQGCAQASEQGKGLPKQQRHDLTAADHIMPVTFALQSHAAALCLHVQGDNACSRHLDLPSYINHTEDASTLDREGWPVFSVPADTSQLCQRPMRQLAVRPRCRPHLSSS